MARLESICTMNMGQSPDSASYNETGEGVPFFQGNADFGEINPQVRVWCSAPTKIAHDGDILISVRAPIGALNIANTECCIGRGLAALTVNEVICEKGYLWYAIATKVEELNAKGSGSTFKAISKHVLAEAEIPLPPIDQQQQIAATLDKVTNLISFRKEQITKLDELVKSQFIEMFGDPILNTMGWPMNPIDELTDSIEAGECLNGEARPRKEGEKAVLKVSAVTYGYFNPNECKVLNNPKDIRKNVTPRKGDLLFSRANTRELVAATAIIDRDYPDLLLPDKLWKLNLNGLVNANYMKQALSSKSARDFFSGQATGTSGSMFNVSMGKLNNLRIAAPPIELQNQFANFVEQADKSKFIIQKSLEKLETLKNALMQRYFG